jgi:hypothetical protein
MESMSPDTIGRHLFHARRRLRLLAPTWVIVAILALLFAILCTGQSGEVLEAIADPASRRFFPLAALYIGTLLCGTSCWYAARVLLYMDYRRRSPGGVEVARVAPARARDAAPLRRVVARLYGFLPFFAVASSLAKAGERGHALAMAACGIAFVAAVYLRRRCLLGHSEVAWVRKLSTETLLGAAVLLAINAAMFGLLARDPVGGAHWIGTAGILLLAFSGWVVIGSAAVHLGYRFFYRRWWPCTTPFLIALALTLLAGSVWRDGDHALRRLDCERQTCAEWPEQTIHDHFDAWIAGRGGAQDLPVVIISAEGGGLRAAYWTASVLGHLSETVPGFACHVYAVSGASGGSVGAAVWVALLSERVPDDPAACGERRPTPDLVAPAQRVLGQDLLAPVIGALLTRDLVGHYWPLPWGDRADAFERGLDAAWQRRHEPERAAPAGGLSFADDFRALWGRQRLRVELPSLFVNASRASNGGPATLSNLDWEARALFARASPTEPDPEKLRSHPLRRRLAHPIPISTALHLGARFPIVSPPATLHCPTAATDGADCAQRAGRVWDTISDGGYFDNSGAFTALELRGLLAQFCPDCRFFHLAITSDTQHPAALPADAPRPREPRLGLRLFETLLRGPTAWRRFAEDRFLRGPASHRIPLRDIDGRRSPPLGWLLHANSHENMKQQLAEVSVDDVRRAIEDRR